jgi:hypothetical protein
MSNFQRRFRSRIRSSRTSTELRLAACALLCVTPLLSGCADFTVVEATAAPSAATLSLPAIGFNHRYGNNPLAAVDGLAMERQFYSEKVFWEVAIHTDPVKAGYVKLGDKAAVRAARHAVTHMLVVVATEFRAMIEAVLAFHGNSAQEMYSQALLGHLREAGYDAITSAEVIVFFTESDQHSKLSWTATGGYQFSIFDNNLQGTGLGLTIGPAMTPLPTPGPPAP